MFTSFLSSVIIFVLAGAVIGGFVFGVSKLFSKFGISDEKLARFMSEED